MKREIRKKKKERKKEKRKKEEKKKEKRKERRLIDYDIHDRDFLFVYLISC